MKLLARIVGLAALAATVVPAWLYLTGSMGLPMVKHLMLVATVVWFVAATLAQASPKSTDAPAA